MEPSSLPDGEEQPVRPSFTPWPRIIKGGGPGVCMTSMGLPKPVNLT